jgi:hypothetical protein
MVLDYKVHAGKLKQESIYGILHKKKELPPPSQLQNQTQYIFTGLFFLVFLALVAFAGGLTYFSSSGFSDSPPGKVKVFRNRAKFMPEFFHNRTC